MERTLNLATAAGFASHKYATPELSQNQTGLKPLADTELHQLYT